MLFIVGITLPRVVALHLPVSEHIAWGCLLGLLQVYYNVYFVCSVSEIANVLPEGVFCCFTRTTLFTTMFTIIVFIEKHVYTKFCLDWLLCQ